MTRQVLGYARTAQTVIAAKAGSNPTGPAHFEQIQHYAKLTEQVISQTQRRVIDDEKVPAQEKIVSIFESHTDIIIKDRRETFYGLKICLTGGASNLILDCVIERGNPADTDLAIPMLDRQNQIYGRRSPRVRTCTFDPCRYVPRSLMRLISQTSMWPVWLARTRRSLAEKAACIMSSVIWNEPVFLNGPME
jgi:hypothetical protein